MCVAYIGDNPKGLWHVPSDLCWICHSKCHTSNCVKCAITCLVNLNSGFEAVWSVLCYEKQHTVYGLIVCGSKALPSASMTLECLPDI